MPQPAKFTKPFDGSVEHSVENLMVLSKGPYRAKHTKVVTTILSTCIIPPFLP